MAIYTVLTTDGRRTEIEDGGRGLETIGRLLHDNGYLVVKDVTRDPQQTDARRDSDIVLFYPNIISIT